MDIQPVDKRASLWRSKHTVLLAVCFGAALLVEAAFLTFGPFGSGIELNDIKAQAARRMQLSSLNFRRINIG